MNNFDRFISENATHPLVVRLLKLNDKPLAMNGSLGKVMGQVMRLADEAYV